MSEIYVPKSHAHHLLPIQFLGQKLSVAMPDPIFRQKLPVGRDVRSHLPTEFGKWWRKAALIISSGISPDDLQMSHLEDCERRTERLLSFSSLLGEDMPTLTIMPALC
jgi:hypothetical protein